uniref:PIN domain-containing protein n=1 Tax=Chlorobium chlorochromatii (strain CaD3) TaxID=340177 RepID=Q3AQX2_CHLCH
MKPIVYLESSVISYLTSRPHRDVVIAGRQAITQEWWEYQRHQFELRISILVEEEISRGDAEAAAQRLASIADIPSLTLSDDAVMIAHLLLAKCAIPKGSEDDALHIGIAAAQGVDFLLTWNFKHINNAVTRGYVTHIVEACGYNCPQLCSPEELMGRYYEYD